MPSSSTGYPERMITKAQPSSSGQYQTFSSGCKLNMKVDSEIEMESGSTFNLEAGAKMNVYGGVVAQTSSYFRIPVESKTSNTTDQKLQAYGLSRLTAATSNPASTGKGGPKYTLRQPKGAGYIKTILLHDTTYTVAIRGSTDKTVEFHTSGKKYYSMLLVGKAGASTSLNSVDIVSLSSVLWALKSKSSGMASVTLSSWYRS
jgi:hypothetical protein